MNRILITGAGGLVGTELLGHLVKSGAEIIALTRGEHNSTSLIRWTPCDLQQGVVLLPRDVGPVNAVIHNAACLLSGRTPAERSELHKVNVAASKSLLEWSIEHGVAKFIFTSTLSQLARPLPDLITEESPVAPSTYYAESKFVFERELFDAAAKGDIQTVVLRISSPISVNPKHFPKNVIGKWIEDARSGQALKVFGSGNRTQDFVCTQDIAEGMGQALLYRKTDLFHIASGHPVRMLDAAQTIAGHFEVDVVVADEDQNENERWNISIEKAVRELGYVPQWNGLTALEGLLRSIKR